MTGVLKIELKKDRIFGLDILRAIAILFVVVQHGSYLLSDRIEKDIYFFIFDGVTIFFVLSGFLIGGILIKTLEKNGTDKKWIINFWKRRWLRTLPAYFFVLTILIILNQLVIPNFNFFEVGNYFFFSQNIINPHPDFFPEAWSLSIEEWFYIVTPILIFVLSNVFKINPKIAILSAAIFIIGFTTYYKYVIISNINVGTIKEWDLLFIFQRYVPRRLDSLMFGVVGAFICFYYPKKWLMYKRFFLLIGILLIFALKYYDPESKFVSKVTYNLFYYSVQPLAILFLLPFFSDLKTGKGYWYRLTSKISLISYSMYLLNYSIIQLWIIKQINWSSVFENGDTIIVINYLLFYVLTILLSILLYKYVELPFMKLRESKKSKNSVSIIV